MLDNRVYKTAVYLRKKGYSYTEISTKLHIAKSTASLWLKTININSKAKQRILYLRLIGRNKANKTKRIKQNFKNIEYRNWAKTVLHKVTLSKELAQIFCSLLYWAEGGKFTTNRLEFTNSDPKMIKSFLKFLRLGFPVDESKLRANIHIHEYHNDEKQKLFWQKITNIKPEQFNKSYLKPHTKKVVRENYQGCVRICYYSSETAKKVKYLYNLLAEL